MDEPTAKDFYNLAAFHLGVAYKEYLAKLEAKRD